MTRSLNGGLRCDDGHQLGYEVSQKRRRATATLADGKVWVHRPHTPFAFSRTSCLLPTSSCDTRHDARLSVHETRHEQSYEPSNIPVTCSSVHAHTPCRRITSPSPRYRQQSLLPRRTASCTSLASAFLAEPDTLLSPSDSRPTRRLRSASTSSPSSTTSHRFHITSHRTSPTTGWLRTHGVDCPHRDLMGGRRDARRG